MDILVLGGTAWLGRETARAAMAHGHSVTCLARGESGDVATGASLVIADRFRPSAYDAVREHDWDAVVEVSWQPGLVREALDALGERAAQWLYVSSGSVYADTDSIGADESARLVPALVADTADRAQYGGAKVACELVSRERVDDRLLIARSGLIGGPGDPSDRTGYWVARAARAPDRPMLVPASQQNPTQMVDVRDLAAWFVHSAENRVMGTFNAVGQVQSFAEWLTLSREIAGHSGDLVAAPTEWLLERGVDSFMGPVSLPVWLADPGDYGFSARRGEAARRAGLRHRPLRETLTDVLADERDEAWTVRVEPVCRRAGRRSC